MQSEVEEDHDFPQPFSTSPALQTCYSRPKLVDKPSPRVWGRVLIVLGPRSYGHDYHSADISLVLSSIVQTAGSFTPPLGLFFPMVG
ncbi:hypothetical protein Taro_016577 [Colocasia esculenta]|uniref:Uncharacterized protein n=1 Tax=Colocasia esculenta TaxID=4460 RepID=A0A843UWN9_COLES|nr:hypothetical protein [Colocasia esculenta]